MSYMIRNTIQNSGLKGIQEKNINDNFISLFSKLENGIDTENISKNVIDMLGVRSLQYYSSNNVDSNNPAFSYFVVPSAPEGKSLKIVRATISAFANKYRGYESIITSTESKSIDFNFTLNQTAQSSVIYADYTSTGYPIDEAGSLHRHTTGHTHDVTGIAHGHTIATKSATLPSHTHTIKTYIKESNEAPSNVRVYVNGYQVGTALSGTGSNFLNAVVQDHTIGANYNEIKVVASNAAKVDVNFYLELAYVESER